MVLISLRPSEGYEPIAELQDLAVEKHHNLLLSLQLAPDVSSIILWCGQRFVYFFAASRRRPELEAVRQVPTPCSGFFTGLGAKGAVHFAYVVLSADSLDLV
jgi:hypothetical protein